MLYTPDVVTGKPKIYGVAEAGESPPTGGKGWLYMWHKGVSISGRRDIGADIHKDMGLLGL